MEVYNADKCVSSFRLMNKKKINHKIFMRLTLFIKGENLLIWFGG